MLLSGLRGEHIPPTSLRFLMRAILPSSKTHLVFFTGVLARIRVVRLQRKGKFFQAQWTCPLKVRNEGVFARTWKFHQAFRLNSERGVRFPIGWICSVSLIVVQATRTRRQQFTPNAMRFSCISRLIKVAGLKFYKSAEFFGGRKTREPLQRTLEAEESPKSKSTHMLNRNLF